MVTHFWWATWAICSHHSLKKRKWVNHSFFSKNLQKCTKKHFSKILLSESLVFCEQNSKWAICSEKRSNFLICSFIMSDLSKLLTFAHLSWATWGIHSRLLFWHERPEQFAHSHSFVLIDLSQLLTVAHMIWAIWLWANERTSNERMSKFPTLRIGEDFKDKSFLSLA